jgi:integrative and conjugative element protein (TIGR02256 family)
MMFTRNFARANGVRVIIPARALEAVFDECDQHNVDETGGRLIGTYSKSHGQLTITVSGVIEPGPAAQRSNTSFFQDGEFQENVFRSIEREHPEIEHLGNWHTHHVNRFPHLSSGDVTTYTRTVNHGSHNTDFFYALLVTAIEPPGSRQRYRVKHYLLRRGHAKVYEIDSRHVSVTKDTLLWPTTGDCSAVTPQHPPMVTAAPTTSTLTQRAHDGIVLHDLYGRIRAFTSAKVALYWRGPIELVDGTDVEVVVVEDASGVEPTYAIGISHPRDDFRTVAMEIAQQQFPSARAALIHAERSCNRAVFAASPGAATIEETTWTS